MTELKILAFDSTAKVASAAVSDGEKILAEYSVDNGLTQSELLLPMAEDILRSLKMSFDDIDLFACSVGPGSFTGVRIGVALVKGLAFGKSIPCAEVSTLEALAENLSGIDGIIAAVMDARRGQFYSALFESGEDGIKRLTDDAALSTAELANALATYEGRMVYLVGDGYIPAKRALDNLGIKTAITPEKLRNESAASVAICAARAACSGKTLSDRDISPCYLRVPQAERERLERLKCQGENGN